MAASDEITVTLDRSVALVLFDFLSRTTDEEDGEPLTDALQHKAELPALWATLAALESVLTEPFAPTTARASRRPRRGREEARRGAAVAARRLLVMRHSRRRMRPSTSRHRIKYKPGPGPGPQTSVIS